MAATLPLTGSGDIVQSSGRIQIHNSVVMVDAPTGNPATDTANINAAIALVSGAGGGTVMLQKGYYNIEITSTQHGQPYGIKMTYGVVLKGVSRYGTKLVPTEDNMAVIVWDDIDQITTGGLSDFQVWGGNYPPAGVIGIVVGSHSLASPLEFFMERVYVSGVWRGIQVNAWLGSIRDCIVRDCEEDGIRLEYNKYTGPSGHTNAVSILETLVGGCGGNAILVRGLSNVISGCNIRVADGAVGIRVQDPDGYPPNTKILSNYIEKSGPSARDITGILFESNTNMVMGNYFDVQNLDQYDTSTCYVFAGVGSVSRNNFIGNFNARPALAGEVLPHQLNADLDVTGHLRLCRPGDDQLVRFPGHHLTIQNEGNNHENVHIEPSGEGASENLHSSLDLSVKNLGSASVKKIMLHTATHSYFNGGNVGIGTESPSQKLTVAGNIAVGGGDAVYFGDANTNGSWRIVRSTSGSGGDLLFQYRQSGSYVTKLTVPH